MYNMKYNTNRNFNILSINTIDNIINNYQIQKKFIKNILMFIYYYYHNF